MWTLAAAIFFGCKWQAWWERRNSFGTTIGRSLGFLFGWPGMDAAAFLDPKKQAQSPGGKEWLWATAKTSLGALLLWGIARRVPARSELLAGWVGMLGIILTLHFGTFHILSLLWRSAGVDARPIMQAPLSATSLSDFWGRRWNLGFRQLTHRLIFRPVRTRGGVVVATLLSFFASGVIHELVISVPARGGYGLPTCYFVAQGLAVLFERSQAGKRLGLSAGPRGWMFALFCAGAPAFLLFHPWFVRGVILPFLTAIGAR
jgi:alginate O-acetyltransferase complex protein AlgI